MPAPRYLPRTKSAGTPGYFTDAQYRALDALKETDTKLLRGAARGHFVNQVLLADGTVRGVDVLESVRSAAAKAERVDQAELRKFTAEHQAEILADSLTPELRRDLVNLRTAAAYRRVEELEDSLAQQRFLIVVDVDLVPHTYFQCFTGLDDKGRPKNPDVDLFEPPKGGLFARLKGLISPSLLFLVGTIGMVAALALSVPAATVPTLFVVGALDWSNALADDVLDYMFDTHFPQNTNLRIRTGGVAGAENADTGTVLATVVLPATPWAAASGGSKAKNGTWQDASADGTGTAGHFRMTGTTTTMIEEGTCTATGGGGDMELDNTSINAAQQVTVTGFTRTL